MSGGGVRRQGKRIGQPPVTTRPGFDRRWAKVREDLEAGRLSRSQAWKRLGVGHASLLRLLAPPHGETTPHQAV